MRVVLLDNEAVQALADPGHRKHRTVLAHLAAVAHRRRRGLAQRVAVPTTVRVEAGWGRGDPAAAVINRHTVVEASLDSAFADTATRIRARAQVSVADAHLGACIETFADDAEVVVLTSDPRDIRAVAGAFRSWS